MSVWIKQGVIGKPAPPLQKAIGKIARIHHNDYGEDLYVTSLEEGNHGWGSLHYAACAVDNRYPKACKTRAEKLAYTYKVRKKLGRDFDVIGPDFPGHDDHLHSEFDKK